jgi:hypothetical protein
MSACTGAMPIPMKKPFILLCAALLVLLTFQSAHLQAAPPREAPSVPYIAVGADAPSAPIVVRTGSSTIDWADVDFEKPDDRLVFVKSHDLTATTTYYLWDAIRRMTGQKLRVTGDSDLSTGIVLVTFAQAPDDLKKDAQVLQALADDGTDSYNANEAYFVRSEKQRVVVIANTTQGLMDGVVALLESIGYEILGFGPNWTYTPDYHDKPLVFAINEAGRAGFYIRYMAPAGGQTGGNGTLYGRPLADPTDETVTTSYERWIAGTKALTYSMPIGPGHALQAYHRSVIAAMLARGSTQGFLVPAANIGLAQERPPAAADNAGQLWINSDPPGQPEAGKVYYSMGTHWDEKPADIPDAIDLTVPFVREIILADFKQAAEANFARAPNDIFVFGTEAEDGAGHSDFAQVAANPNWYPEYLAAQKIPFGQPYALHGFKGLDQPHEIWDATSPNDTEFAFNNWLLREFDRYVDSLPEKQRFTATGRSKKELVRTHLYSYSYHDVPPDFNLDPRIRLMVAGYPTHRGAGKWKKFVTQNDIAAAFKILLPREPTGIYWILSQAYYSDAASWSIKGSESAAKIHDTVRELYDSGTKALQAETDLNFGKKGLEYYLYSKMLWNPRMTTQELEAIRTRWLQRAFGAGWREMKEYYDFMAPENYTVNSPSFWARAIRFIDAADAKIPDDSIEQKRLDDVKQFWYFYYFQESGQAQPPSRAFREFMWKGQMSYMTAMEMASARFFNTFNLDEIAGPEFNRGRAHYTHEETQQWWARVLDLWPLTPAEEFRETTLANGRLARNVDLNDLVPVAEFRAADDGPTTWDQPFQYPSVEWRLASFLTVASAPGQEIGFKLLWPWRKGQNDYAPFDVSYGISRWNDATKKWETLVDKKSTYAASEPLEPLAWRGDEPQQIAVARFTTPAAGTYRIDVGNGGASALLTSLAFDENTGNYTQSVSQTYFGSLLGYTQSKAYFYIPKSTTSLDFEYWNVGATARIELYTGLPSTGMKLSRTVELSKTGPVRIPLQLGEAGSFATFYGANFGFPYLHSVPLLWAKSPSALLVPREIATADNLTIVK